MGGYKIIVEKAKGNFSAYAPALPGRVATAQPKQRHGGICKKLSDFIWKAARPKNQLSKDQSVPWYTHRLRANR